MNKSEVISFLFLVAALAFGLLIADRILRISIYIQPFEGTSDAVCGVDMTPCQHPLQCINGYCKSANAPRLPVATGLPVVP